MKVSSNPALPFLRKDRSMNTIILGEPERNRQRGDKSRCGCRPAIAPIPNLSEALSTESPRRAISSPGSGSNSWALIWIKQGEMML